ncbi:hypothetical protein GEV33_004204 [Tenebrio molitor]|uniref:DUF659 domain-containing protein n=1 Tax=Tenebrio molitor TaxID=7067 RepID=A0A8J6LGB0_TENMO|nr:hypothetical protein GEV33_004204 [Tenebrio molitor]
MPPVKTCQVEKWTKLDKNLSVDGSNVFCQACSKPEDISENYIWISVDETTDVKGRYIANMIVGKLTQEEAGNSHLLASKELEKTNHKAIVNFVDDSLRILYPEGVKKDKVLLFLSDAAPDMKKAETAIDGRRSRAAMGKTLQQWFDELITIDSDGVHQIVGAINKIIEFRCQEIAAKLQPTPREEETISDSDSIMDARHPGPHAKKGKWKSSHRYNLEEDNPSATGPTNPTPRGRLRTGEEAPSSPGNHPRFRKVDGSIETSVHRKNSFHESPTMRRRDPRPVRRIERIPRRYPPSREQAGSFSHFTLQEEKRVRVVLKPVPREIPVEEIAEDLEAQGFHPIGVHRMRRLISKKELPLVLVELPPSEKNIFELKTPVPQLSVVSSLTAKLPRRAALREMW